MNNLPKGFYYNKEGALVNSNKTKTKLEKKVEVLEVEIQNLKKDIKWLIQKYES